MNVWQTPAAFRWQRHIPALRAIHDMQNSLRVFHRELAGIVMVNGVAQCEKSAKAATQPTQKMARVDGAFPATQTHYGLALNARPVVQALAQRGLQMNGKQGGLGKSGGAVVQCFGDKVVPDFNVLEGEFGELSNKLKEIYDIYRSENKTKRSGLDEDYKTKSAGLANKQEYLRLKTASIVITKINSNLVSDNDKINDALILDDLSKSTLSELEKTPLDNEAENLSVLVMTAIGYNKDSYNQKMTIPNKNRKEKYIEYFSKAINGNAKAFAFHRLGDPIVLGYERGYMNSAFRLAELEKRWKEYAENKNFTLVFEQSESIIKVSAKKEGTEFSHICTLYQNDARFEKTSEPIIEGGSSIFTHRGNKQDYIQEATGKYVKRTVSRALNKFDVNTVDKDTNIHHVSIKGDPREKRDTNKSGQIMPLNFTE